MELLTVWLLTYLLHSTLLLGGAALLRLILRESRLGLQEATLRAALVGGLLTASLQLGLGIEPMGGVLTLPEDPAPVTTSERLAPRSGLVFGPVPVVLDQFEARTESTSAARPWELPSPAGWRPFLGGLWIAAALFGLGRLAAAALGLRRLLRQRQPVLDEALTSRVAAVAVGLGLRRRVPLSTAPRLEVPLATGVFHPEVCLPTRALEELEADQQVAVCAHELAHVARRDPAWILVARGIEAVAPLQPLNTWARRRLQDLAECLSDDLAVAASGRPLGLARSLVDVAEWTLAEPLAPPAAAAGALSSRSRLGHRVERLMDPMRSLERPGRFLLPLAALAVLATAFLTPVVSGSPVAEPLNPTEAVEPPEPPAPPAPPAAPEAPAPPEPPEPEERSDTAAERRLEELTREIERRADAHGPQLEEIGEAIEALVEANRPDEKELEVLAERVETAARVFAEATLAAHGTQATERTGQEVEEARANLAEAQEAIQKAVRAVRVPEPELRELRKQAREIAESFRLTAEERDEIRRLTEEIVKEHQPDMESLEREMKQMRRELERESLSEITETLRLTRREIQVNIRESLPEMRELARVAREAAREAMRGVDRSRTELRRRERVLERESRRESREERRRESREAHERTRTLEDAERSHLGSTDEAPDPDQ